MKLMRDPNLKWHDWRKDKPPGDDFDSSGLYLVWSERRGIRLISQHPSWWNKPGKFRGEPVRLWYRLGPVGLGWLLKADLKRSARTSRSEPQ